MDTKEMTKQVVGLMESHGVIFTKNAIESLALFLGKYSMIEKQDRRQPDLSKRISQYLAAKKVDGLSQRTLGNYMQILKSFANRISKNVTQVNVDDIRGYLVFLVEDRKLKDTSLQTHLQTIRAFFSWLQMEGIIRKNPLLKIKSKRLDRNKSRHALPAEDLERLRDACQGYREKALVEFLYSTGCRVSEAADILVSHMDFQHRSVRVQGKGGKVRTVYFSVKAKLMIMEHLRSRPGGEYLFCAGRGSYHKLSTRSIQKIVKGIGERAMLSSNVHPHLFRHTFATDAINRGMDITSIQMLLGHSDPGTTQIYAEMSQETVNREYNTRFVA